MNHLGLFAKFWQPGKVKTRLAATIGDQAACVIYQYFVAHLLDQLRACGDQRTVVFSPPDAESGFRRQISPEWDLHPQTSGDLGDRMEHFFQQSQQQCQEAGNGNSSSRRKTVVIGADTPNLTATEIEKAFDLLDRHDAVLGACQDGGYYLVGMSGSFPGVFDGVEWSSGEEFRQTLENFERHSIDVGLLEVKNDIDDYDDLVHYRDEVCRHDCNDSAIAALNRELIDSIVAGQTSGDAAGVALLRGPLE